MGGENGVVGLDNSGRDTGGWVDGELELALLGVVSSKTFEQESSETGSSTTTERVEDQETLEGRAVVCNGMSKYSIVWLGKRTNR